MNEVFLFQSKPLMIIGVSLFDATDLRLIYHHGRTRRRTYQEQLF